MTTKKSSDSYTDDANNFNINDTDTINSHAQSGPELSIIIPTYNERDNVDKLLNKLSACLEGRN